MRVLANQLTGTCSAIRPRHSTQSSPKWLTGTGDALCQTSAYGNSKLGPGFPTFVDQIGVLKTWTGTSFTILLKVEREEGGNIAYLAPPLLRIKRTKVEESLPTAVYPRQVLCCLQEQFEKVKEEYEIAQCVDLVLEGHNHGNLIAFMSNCLEKSDILGDLDERRAMSITFACKRGKKWGRTQQLAEKVLLSK